MENLKEVFKEKNFDDLTLHYINNFIEEFDELFGKYVSKEELVKRIKENLNYSFEFVENEEADGTYNYKEKRIKLSNKIKDNEERIKEVVFHEMIHCITAREGYVGFSKNYYIENDVELGVITAHGLTEGFTQYLTQIRNKKFNNVVVTSYPILSEQTNNLAELLGEEILINLGLNNPEGLYTEMEKHFFINDEFEYDSFLFAFDEIWKNEHEIYLNRKQNTSAESRLLKAIFGNSRNITGKELVLNNAKRALIEIFLNQFKNVEVKSGEDLESIYDTIYKYAIQIDAEDNLGTYTLFFEKVDEYIGKIGSTEMILSELSEDLQLIVSENLCMKEFLDLPANERLRALEEDYKITKIIENSKFQNDYIFQTVDSLFGPDINNKTSFYYAIINGLAKEILDKRYDFNKISIEIIDLDSYSELTFNLYENSGTETKYLGTYSRENAEGEVSQFTVITSQEEIDSILENNPDIPQNAVIMKDKYDCILAYSGDNEYILINDMEEIFENHGETIYVPSFLELEYKKIDTRITTYERMQEMDSPKPLIKEQERLLKEVYASIVQIEGNRTITIEELESFVTKVILSKIEELSNKRKNAMIDRKKAIEEDIGYRE